MAKTIKDAIIVTVHASGSAHSNFVHATVVMPVSEFAAFQAIGDLTDAVPEATTTFILAAGDTGTAQ
jgi:hypothetical protein